MNRAPRTALLTAACALAAGASAYVAAQPDEPLTPEKTARRLTALAVAAAEAGDLEAVVLRATAALTLEPDNERALGLLLVSTEALATTPPRKEQRPPTVSFADRIRRQELATDTLRDSVRDIERVVSEQERAIRGFKEEFDDAGAARSKLERIEDQVEDLLRQTKDFQRELDRVRRDVDRISRKIR